MRRFTRVSAMRRWIAVCEPGSPHLTKEYIARRESEDMDAMSAKALLELAGSWEDDGDSGVIVREIKAVGGNQTRHRPCRCSPLIPTRSSSFSRVTGGMRKLGLHPKT